MSTTEQPWIEATKARWQELNAEFFLTSIGIDFKTNFSDSISNSKLSTDPYSNSIWKIVPHSLVPQGVLHCYPKLVASEKVIWEEWFLMDNEIHHHILSNQPFDSAQGIWTPEPDDADHPIEVLGRSWHYENSKNLKPTLY
ncbi:hypothetical protein MCEMKE157_01242 [actinobacterium SCGC AAA044-D11]|jgi:hypothetical protein